MSVLSWGKPTLEIAASTDGTPGTYTSLDTPKEDSSKLTTTKGDKVSATAEGGETVDVRFKKSSFSFEFELFVKKGNDKPIEDDDGVISDKYAIRLTPEDDSLEGFVMENCTVSIEETWSAADGKTWKYTFDGLKPASGKTLKPYTKTTETT